MDSSTRYYSGMDPVSRNKFDPATDRMHMNHPCGRRRAAFLLFGVELGNSSAVPNNNGQTELNNVV